MSFAVSTHGFITIMKKHQTDRKKKGTQEQHATDVRSFDLMPACAAEEYKLIGPYTIQCLDMI
jgi:hypothetical protein